VKVDDGRPVTVDSPEGKKEVPSTRTYLSLMFRSAVRARARRQGTVPFAGECSGSGCRSEAGCGGGAASSRCPRGAGFLGQGLPRLYGGRSAAVRRQGSAGHDYRGREYKITYALGDPNTEKALEGSFGSLIMHRRGGNPEYAANWRDSEVHPMGRAINLNDESESFYRVRDRQILQVNRIMGSLRFTTNVLENERTPADTFLPRAWTVSYYDRQSGALTRSSTTFATWGWVGQVFVSCHAGSGVGGQRSERGDGAAADQPRLLK